MHCAERLLAIRGMVVLGVALGLTPSVIADQQTSTPGEQVMVARFTSTPVLIDGVRGPAEWSAAIPVHVPSNTPATAPGVVPNLSGAPYLLPPDNEDDSSFTVYAMYANDNLYIAVDVADDLLYSDSQNPWEDDDVEVFIDGDNQPGDLGWGVWCASNPCQFPVVNNEGFQLITSVSGARMTNPPNNPAIVWESAAGPRPRGFLVEFKIPLDSINTHNTSWWAPVGTPGFQRPGPGDSIGLNVAVGDDDNGGASYNDGGTRTDSFTAWDGSSPSWGPMRELDWGTLYFLP